MKRVKGDPRVTVLCGAVEELIFGSRYDPGKVFGRRKNRAKRGVQEAGEWKSVDMVDSTPQTYGEYTNDHSMGKDDPDVDILADDQEQAITFGAGKARPPQDASDINFSVGGERGWVEKIEETEELKQKRLVGQRKAEEREAVRCAARRLCVFGSVVLEEPDGNERETSAPKAKQKRRVNEKVASQETEHIERKKCEAVTKEGTVVEPSFAKGEWGIRWRE